MALEYFNIQGVNTYQNALESDGQLIHANNVVGFPLGGISKRPGYTAFQSSLGAQVNSLFSFPMNNGTQIFLYAAAGTTLNYSVQGTGAWTLGTTIANGQHVGAVTFNNVLTVGDGVNTLMNSTTGTTFSTPGSAPVAQYLAQFHNRVYTTDGTSGNVQFSVANDPTNWQNSGTSDSSFLIVPTEGACAGVFVAGDRLDITQTRGGMYNWDDTTLVDMSTKYGPSSPWSIAQIDDTWFYLNQYGIHQFDGANKQLISNPIQRQFYNRNNTGIANTSLGTAPGVAHIWDYLVAVGTITDDFTGRTINNAMIKYDFQKNQFMNWSFADAPTAFHSYIDSTKKRQLVFGNATGQVFQLDQTKTSDNGAPIQSEAVFLFTYASQSQTFSQTTAATLFGSTYEKKWDWIRLFFNPGDEVNIQYAFSNGLTYQHLRWSEAINTRTADGDYYQISDGVVEIRFPLDLINMPRSRFLFLRIYDDSDSSSWQYLGCQISATPQPIM